MTTHLVQETRLFNLSTTSSAGTILNSDSNYKSKIQYDIPDMIPRDESIEFINFSIPYAVIPVSFYTINASNCNLDISISENPMVSYLFPYGNYTASTFMTQFKTLLGTGWSISLSNTSNIFTIAYSGNIFSILGTTGMDYILGFSGTITSSEPNPTIATLVLPRTCNFLPLPRVLFRCEELANSTIVGSNRSTDIILSAPNNSKQNGQIYYQNQTQAKMLYKGDFLNRFIVSLTDEKANLINFNGVSSFFVFQFDIFRTHQPKPPLFYNLVNYVNKKNQEQDLEKQSLELNMASGN